MRRNHVSVIDAMLMLRIAWCVARWGEGEQILVELMALQEHPDCVRFMELRRMRPIAPPGF